MPFRPDVAGGPRLRVVPVLAAAALAAGLAAPLGLPAAAAIGPTGGIATAADEPTVAAAADGPTVGIAAAPAQEGQPDGRARFDLSVTPGQKADDQLLVRNDGSAETTFDVYATDAFDTADGAFALLEGSATPSGAGTWVAFEGGSRTTKIQLAAGAQALVPFTVTAPAGATPGDHAGGIVVSTSSGNVDRRLATRLYVRVRGTVTPALVVRSLRLSQPAGGNPLAAPATITAVVENTGDVALSAHAEASVRSWFGVHQGRPVSDDVAEMLPGATRRLTFDVGPVGRLGYVAPHLTLTPAADSAAYDVVLPPVDARGTGAAVPWLVLAIVAIAGAGAWMLVVRRRARPPAQAGRAQAEPVRTATDR